MKNIINESEISELINTPVISEDEAVEQVLNKSTKLARLSLAEVAVLVNATKQSNINKIYKAANKVKDLIYGNRIVFFAPLYVSNFCENNCVYCGFKKDKRFKRSVSTKEDMIRETEALLRQGHKRILLVAGEGYPKNKGLDYILEAIDTIYSVSVGKNKIRRINVNIAPLETDQFQRLKARDIGTYQLFQETYHRETYKNVHTSGPKSNYDYRLSAVDRAFDAGIDDLGIGVLFGLYDWKFELMSMLKHVEYLEEKHGLGPHTMSIPRIEPAEGVDFVPEERYKVSDEDFKKIVAILRLAVPYTGLILSTRETPEVRRDVLSLGISQISAGSKTNPGGYSEKADASTEQFSLGDHRSLDEVVQDLLSMGYLPSFCTACYRLGRTGLDFMEYAKPGDIKKKCLPNALFTFLEYLRDFGSKETIKLGEIFIRKELSKLPEKMSAHLQKELDKIDDGERDIYI